MNKVHEIYSYIPVKYCCQRVIYIYSYSGSVMEDDIYLGRCENSVPYYINCSGYFKIDSWDVSLKRTRLDYYLIYLVNGVGHYSIGDETITARAGSMVIFKPHQQQDYYYLASEKAEVYWIHFTGYEAEQLVSELGFGDGIIYHAGIHTEHIDLFEKIIHELQIKKLNYHNICIGYFLQLLTSLSRKAGALQSGGGKLTDNRMEKVIKTINEEFQLEHAIGYYARICNLSIFQFIRNFKAFTGYSPARYIEKIRIAKARELLHDTNLSISEIAAIVGYQDPFYFSKVFKKASGLTPSEFRSSKQDK